MMLEFFRFELKQQVRAPLLWVMAVMFGLFAFAVSSSDAVQLGSAVGNVDRNAPTVIATFMGMFTVLGLLVMVAFVSNALLRDFEIGTADLFFSMPMRKRDFLVGRFSAAVVACSLIFVVVAVGLMIGPLMPWVDPERVAAFSLRPYLWSFAVIVLPNLLFTCALLALLAVTTRSLLVTYLGVIGFFILYSISRTLTRDLDSVWMATLLDPLGMAAVSRTIRYWSAEQRNTQLPELAGYLLANRALWLALAVAIATSAFALFKPLRTGTGKAWFMRRKTAAADASDTPGHERPPTSAMPRVAPSTGAGVAWRQFLRQWRFDTVGVLKGVPFLVMLVFALANFLAIASLSQSQYGTSIHPVTSQMLQSLAGGFSFMLIFVVMFYAGELVWKERTARLDGVIDAFPVPNWVPLAAKMSALVAVVVVYQAVGGLVAVGFQLVKGFTAIEPMVYLRGLLVDSVPFVLMGGLALVLQVLANNKFIGYGLLIAWLVLQGTLGFLDFDHNLYSFGSAPGAPYSDMNGYGHFLRPRLVFQAYWGACLLALLLVCAAFWVRGAEPSRRDRFRLASQRLAGRNGVVLAAAAALFAALGGYIFWNTNVLNEYVPGDVVLDRQQRYEENYRKYLDLPQPRVLAVTTDVDLRPETRQLRIRGRYTITNPHDAPIRDFHIQLIPQTRVHELAFGDAQLTLDDQQAAYRIYRLDTPMQPGEQRELSFDIDYGQVGFGNGTADTQVVENGSFFNSGLLPGFGYSEGAQIQDRNERRKRDMPELPRMAKLEDTAARANTYISDDADWITFSTTICTAPDQVALAPGLLQREFDRDGRRCFEYAMQRPMLDFFAYLSARWKVKRGAYKDIPIEVYYDPKHPYNVDRMIEAVQKSLAYYEANFSPYQNGQVRIIEFPGYSTFAQSFAGTIPYSESIGFIADLRDEEAIDYVFYVTAHEVAHQWWAHQVIGGDVQGSTMLSESLSQYSALMVMEQAYGRDKMRRFLKYELDSYLSGRAGESVEELPLYRVENQQYIHYRKGSLAFYRLREEIGEDALNRALAKFLRDKGYQLAPFTTSAELLDYIRAEAGPRFDRLITDLFEEISFYDNRVQAATATRRKDGRYDVTLDLHAAKLYADGEGKETAAALDDWMDVGVFAKDELDDETDGRVLYLKRHYVTQTSPRLTVTVDGLPHEAGLDPYNKLIDRVSDDNRKQVTVQ